MQENDQLQSYITELRRGSLTLAVLGCLNEPRYGYDLLRYMKEKQIDIEANTLYPLLRRLESQDLLNGTWNTGESRPRKYYIINEKGRQIFNDLMNEWKKMQHCIDDICGKEDNDEQFN